MSEDNPRVSVALDTADEQLVRSLQLQPRAPFSLIGEVIGLSEQTVARRYRRLRREGLLRVTAGFHPSALGRTVWIVRVRCRPDGARSVAEALARRDDVSWVTIVAGGAEVVFHLGARSDRDAEDLLTRLLPRTAPVLDVSAAAVLRMFAGGDPADWDGLRDALTEGQSGRLREARSHGAPPQTVPRQWSPRHGDDALLDALVLDGRAAYSALARAAGTSAGKARRRVESLLDAGVIYIDVDLAPALIGYATPMALLLTVAPGRLDAVGRALAEHPLVPFVVAVTGPANIFATLTTDDPEQSYAFITGTLGATDGITGYEMSPLLRQVKQSGAYVVDGRLSVSPPGPARPATAPANRGGR